MLPKTPLPTSGEDLCATELGSSHMIEVFNEACTCGRPLGTLEFDLARFVASHKELTSTEAVCRFMTSLSLPICCRNQVISPLVQAIVCADIGVRYIDADVAQFLKPCAVSENAPPAISNRIGNLPVLIPR